MKKPDQTWAWRCPRPGLRGLPRPLAPDRQHARARALAPARLAALAKERAQEDKPQAIKARWLPDAVLQAWPCRPLPRQGHARGVTQEDELSSASRG
jgi:hypothetical protein